MTGSALIVEPGTGEVMRFDGLQVLIPGRLTPVSYQPPPGLSFDEWGKIGTQLEPVASSINWWLGDWMLYGEGNFAQKSAQAAEATGRAAQTLLNARWVASKFPIPYRRERLRWHHHAAAAGLPTEEACEVLDEAEIQGWDVRDVREEVARRKGREPRTVLLRDTVTAADGAFEGHRGGLSAAIAAWLAEGRRLAAEVRRGVEFTVSAEDTFTDEAVELLQVLDRLANRDARKEAA